MSNNKSLRMRGAYAWIDIGLLSDCYWVQENPCFAGFKPFYPCLLSKPFYLSLLSKPFIRAFYPSLSSNPFIQALYPTLHPFNFTLPKCF
jgi:hypothetical protein